uniref:Uncharacterized protein n=1 Tax=Anguilla anguilla TaxID=7936 RepID=A0A0E9Q0D5_ANGAN
MVGSTAAAGTLMPCPDSLYKPRVARRKDQRRFPWVGVTTCTQYQRLWTASRHPSPLRKLRLYEPLKLK